MDQGMDRWRLLFAGNDHARATMALQIADDGANPTRLL
jgi:hypothetical protein